MVNIDHNKYWDGGVFSNTPMSEAINCFEDDGLKQLVVVNLFRNGGGIPSSELLLLLCETLRFGLPKITVT